MQRGEGENELPQVMDSHFNFLKGKEENLFKNVIHFTEKKQVLGSNYLDLPL